GQSRGTGDETHEKSAPDAGCSRSLTRAKVPILCGACGRTSLILIVSNGRMSEGGPGQAGPVTARFSHKTAYSAPSPLDPHNGMCSCTVVVPARFESGGASWDYHLSK